jgi:hypothetical protein
MCIADTTVLSEIVGGLWHYGGAINLMNNNMRADYFSFSYSEFTINFLTVITPYIFVALKNTLGVNQSETTITMDDATFWDIAPCSPYGNQRFEEIYHLHLQDPNLAAQVTSVRQLPSHRLHAGFLFG